MALVSAYNSGVFCRKYKEVNNISSLRELAKKLKDIKGYSVASISLFVNFSLLMDKISKDNENMLCFLFTCKAPWREVKSLLTKTDGRNGDVDKCPLGTALKSIQL